MNLKIESYVADGPYVERDRPFAVEHLDVYYGRAHVLQGIELTLARMSRISASSFGAISTIFG